MKRIILVGAIALLAACGSSGNDVSSGTAADSTTPPAAAPAATDTTDPARTTPASAAGSDDTITVENFGDMPPKCIELLGKFLKQIEPTVSKIDWEKATLAEFDAFGEQFKTESDAFDAETTAAGCNKYNLNGSDEKQFQQMAELAASEAPGALGFINFLGALSASANATGGSIPADCAGTIAAIEPYLTQGTMKDLTMVEVTTLGSLMNGVSTKCTSEESAAFFARDDVNTYIQG